MGWWNRGSGWGIEPTVRGRLGTMSRFWWLACGCMFGDQTGMEEFRAKLSGGLWAERKGMKDCTQEHSPALFGRAPLGAPANGTVDIGPWD